MLQHPGGQRILRGRARAERGAAHEPALLGQMRRAGQQRHRVLPRVVSLRHDLGQPVRGAGPAHKRAGCGAVPERF